MDRHDDVLAYSIPDFCRATGTSRSKTYEEIKSGRLRAVKLGARTLIRKPDAQAWLDSLTEERESA